MRGVVLMILLVGLVAACGGDDRPEASQALHKIVVELREVDRRADVIRGERGSRAEATEGALQRRYRSLEQRVARRDISRSSAPEQDAWTLVYAIVQRAAWEPIAKSPSGTQRSADIVAAIDAPGDYSALRGQLEAVLSQLDGVPHS